MSGSNAFEDENVQGQNEGLSAKSDSDVDGDHGGGLRKVALSAIRNWYGSDEDKDKAAGQSSGFRAPKFSDLPSFQAIEKQRSLGKLFGVADPFYRVHGAVEGANSLIDGEPHVNFASYDYLGLNQHPNVAAAAKQAIDQHRTSVSASRIVAGERPVHRELEEAIAEFYEAEDAIAFVSGHATNVSTIATIMGPQDVIIHDELMHNSALVGAKLSGATTFAFRHNSMAALEALLEEHRAAHRHALVLVEGLYSMDGDLPDLPKLIELKERYGAWLMVDEAHSLGVLGKTGRGIAEHYGVDPRKVDVWMGTLSKTLASCGGYIAGSRELIDVLKFNAPGFVYSVGMPASAAAAAKAALDALVAEPERVERLQRNGSQFLAEAKEQGLDTGTSEGFAVVSIMIGDILRAVKLSERLLERGINALPIVYPAVPMKAARIRFFITAHHRPEDISKAVSLTQQELSVSTWWKDKMVGVMSSVTRG
ncbi:MAG: aminotransferase class I/II-fold pyridoxal phosphate-dependent enzyme [Hyphomicrobiaceae bacterium]